MNCESALLSLVRLGLGHHTTIEKEQINWELIKALALQQGVYAIALDGIEKLPETIKPPKDVLLEWIGETLQCYDYRYKLYCRAIADLARFYNTHSFQMMVLKGYACGLNWPKPEKRPCGDIDIWLFGNQRDADRLIAKERGIKVDYSHHHHTVFYWHDFMVENHYDFINVHQHKSNQKIELFLKELGKDDSNHVELYGERIYLPTPTLHSLFLLKHMMLHFASEGITLRQLLDWGFFVKKNKYSVDWEWLEDILTKYAMKDLYGIFNAICVEDLGFSSDVFYSVQFNPILKERILRDIISPEFSNKKPQSLIPRALYRYNRWKANEWKHKLCNNESMWSSFWSGVINHLMKPSSI